MENGLSFWDARFSILLKEIRDSALFPLYHHHPTLGTTAPHQVPLGSSNLLQPSQHLKPQNQMKQIVLRNATTVLNQLGWKYSTHLGWGNVNIFWRFLTPRKDMCEKCVHNVKRNRDQQSVTTCLTFQTADWLLMLLRRCGTSRPLGLIADANPCPWQEDARR